MHDSAELDENVLLHQKSQIQEDNPGKREISWRDSEARRLPKNEHQGLLEGHNPFCRESHGPNHSQGWEPPTPGGAW